jgi:hypothetical protein
MLENGWLIEFLSTHKKKPSLHKTRVAFIKPKIAYRTKFKSKVQMHVLLKRLKKSAAIATCLSHLSLIHNEMLE